ncbi:MAG TPA: hypothetical protein VMR25_22430 [Planctomycetaceae bacterium]|nr:hypothetical protein [Planctomycetaceae bacterium]
MGNYWVLMGTHWHFVVWPRRGQEARVSDFFRWLTVTHSQRWHAHHGTAGRGHVFEGRIKFWAMQGEMPAGTARPTKLVIFVPRRKTSSD